MGQRHGPPHGQSNRSTLAGAMGGRLTWHPQDGQKGHLPRLLRSLRRPVHSGHRLGGRHPHTEETPNTRDLSPAPLGTACGGRLSKVRRLDRHSRHLRLLVGTEPEVLLEDEEERVLLPTVVDHQGQRNVLTLHRSQLALWWGSARVTHGATLDLSGPWTPDGPWGEWKRAHTWFSNLAGDAPIIRVQSGRLCLADSVRAWMAGGCWRRLPAWGHPSEKIK